MCRLSFQFRPLMIITTTVLRIISLRTSKRLSRNKHFVRYNVQYVRVLFEEYFRSQPTRQSQAASLGQSFPRCDFPSWFNSHQIGSFSNFNKPQSFFFPFDALYVRTIPAWLTLNNLWTFHFPFFIFPQKYICVYCTVYMCVVGMYTFGTAIFSPKWGLKSQRPDCLAKLWCVFLNSLLARAATKQRPE